MLRICMQSFIELAWLLRVLKSGELKDLRRSKWYYFWSDFSIFLGSVKTEVFKFKNAVFCNIFVLPRRIYNSIWKGIALLESTLNRLQWMPFWQTTFVWIYTLSPAAPPLVFLAHFREIWGGDCCHVHSINKAIFKYAYDDSI